jgi:DNA invertase Pin-like site-specific DNA recombinase
MAECTPMKNKAYSYIRFSSPEQAKGRSYERQRDECVSYCKKHGLELAKGEEYTFFDKGLSAYKGDHVGENGQLARFMRLVDDGDIEPGSTLIVESLDRLSRQDITIALPMFMGLIAKGIRVVTLIDQRMYTKEGGEVDLILSIFSLSRANDESRTKSTRIRDVWNIKHAKARDNKTPKGQTAPLWIDFEKHAEYGDDKDAIARGRYVLNEGKTAVVRRIFQMAIEGYGRGATIKALNAEGIPSLKGKTWGTSSVEKVLRNRAVLGEYQPMHNGKPNGDPIEAYFPKALDEATYYQAQEAIAVRKTGRVTKQSKNFQIWQGVGRCAICQAALHMVDKGKGPKGGSYLRCANVIKGICDTKSVRLSKAEEVFRELLTKVNSLPLIRDSQGRLEKTLREVDGRLQEQKEKHRKYEEALEQDIRPILVKMERKTAKDIDELHKQKEELLTMLATERITDKDDFFAKLDLLTYEGRARANALLKRLKITVLIGKEADGITYYYVIQGANAICGYVQEKIAEPLFVPFNVEQVSNMKVQGDESPFGSLTSRSVLEGSGMPEQPSIRLHNSLTSLAWAIRGKSELGNILALAHREWIRVEQMKAAPDKLARMAEK